MLTATKNYWFSVIFFFYLVHSDVRMCYYCGCIFLIALIIVCYMFLPDTRSSETSGWRFSGGRVVTSLLCLGGNGRCGRIHKSRMTPADGPVSFIWSSSYLDSIILRVTSNHFIPLLMTQAETDVSQYLM